MKYLAILNDKKFNITLNNDPRIARDELMQMLDNAINIINSYTYNSYDDDDSIIEQLLDDTTLESEEVEE